MISLKPNMQWPPNEAYRVKLNEHSAWYSGDANVLANYYHNQLTSAITGLPYTLERDLFWARQIVNDAELGIHVPIAGDIASTAADLLFSEPPRFQIVEAYQENASALYLETQKELDKMLVDAGYYRKIIEGAEAASALGGVVIKMAWDSEISPYPLPVIEHPDGALPEFMFGVLRSCLFWKTIDEDTTKNKIYRLLEFYERDGSIRYELRLGTQDRLGEIVPMSDKFANNEYIDVSTGYGAPLCVYVPNMLPNRLYRGAYIGRSDYTGIEGLMDSLDETFSAWMKDIVLGQGKVMVPGEFLQKSDTGLRYNIDQMMFAKLDMDPTVEGSKITAVQFAIRSAEFEKTAMNLIERIISSAGFSPQSFGLQIEGRAESGTALAVRERKSMNTKRKKEQYWDDALKRLIKMAMVLYKTQLGGKVEVNGELTIQFSDSFTNDLTETSAALAQLETARAVSTITKVRMLHPDWSEAEVLAESELIIKEQAIGAVQSPDDIDPDNPGDMTGGKDGDEDDQS